MKKLIALALAALMAFACLACAKKEQPAEPTKAPEISAQQPLSLIHI